MLDYRCPHCGKLYRQAGAFRRHTREHICHYARPDVGRFGFISVEFAAGKAWFCFKADGPLIGKDGRALSSQIDPDSGVIAIAGHVPVWDLQGEINHVISFIEAHPV